MIRKIALNWNSSYTELAAEQLCRYCSHAGIADFSDTLILVPTAEAGRLLREEMEQVVTLKVPLRVEVSSGANWYEAK